VNVGFMKYDGVDMKGQRGKSLPLTITKSSDSLIGKNLWMRSSVN
jgi:hypothetical protein